MTAHSKWTALRPFHKKVEKYWVSQKMYTKLIKRNLKLIALINNMQLFLVSTQSNFNFEPSFARIHKVLREIWLFKHKFPAGHFDQL